MIDGSAARGPGVLRASSGRWVEATLCAGLIAVAAGVYGLYGFQGTLLHDDAYVVYAGQQLVDGVPPYTSVFLQKGPIHHFVSAIAVRASHALATDEILTVRTVFFALSCLTVACLYLLGKALFTSRRVGLLVALVFLGFWGFGHDASSGPQMKTLTVAFGALALLLTARRRWFWAGLCGSLGFFTWQPLLVYPAATLVLGVVQAAPGRRWRNALLATAGGLVPAAAVSAYFLATGSFGDFFDGFLLYNISYLNRGATSLVSHLGSPIVAVYRSFTTMAVPIFLGMGAVFMLYVWRWREVGGAMAVLQRDRFAAILLTFPAPILWSLIDFQSYPDFLPFLPYAALGFGWLLDLSLIGLGRTIGDGRTAESLATGLVGAILVATAAITYQQSSEQGLRDQRRWALEVESRFGMDARVATVGVPEMFVLLGKRSPTRFINIYDGIDGWIEAREPGGLAAWAEGLRRFDPDVVGISRWRFLGPTPLGERGVVVRRQVQAWLDEEYEPVQIGAWDLWARKAPRPRQPH